MVGFLDTDLVAERLTLSGLVWVNTLKRQSIKQARAKRAQCREWLDNGEDPVIQLSLVKVKRKEAVTVKDALEYWLVEYATEHRKNVDKTKAQFERHLYPYIGKYPLEKTTKPQWLECFDRIKKGIPNERKGAPVAAGQVLQGAKQALLFCRKREYATSYVIDDLTTTDVGKKQNKRDRVLNEVELQDVIDNVKTAAFKNYYSNLIWLLIVFGARSQEIRLSTWKEWDFEKGLWTVPKANSKTAELIIRPIPKSLYPWLKRLKAVVVKLNWPRFYSLASIFSLTRLVSNHHYADAA
ncbi:hypothetical protein A9267_09975 [Shewanella sp. UCD-FRSSP16_17]|nr:hypothetical protein A9267_09975 [Shewanella sp. UCD-FRSSP16_17]